ncbi:phospholipase D-like domain-containing protein [Deinococcus navajonensis]|uniref:Phospholipase D-like domain-containing protein n=1 Tax=Deinococcus navajonensis TaxID=309884 RepID=A0ABV8XMC4_9DEIO
MRLLPSDRPPQTLRRLAWSAVAGLLVGLLLARGVVTLVLALLPPEQPYLRALVGTLGALLSVILGFSLSGALSTRGLPLIRLGLGRSQARARAALAAGSTAGLLVLPAAGLLALAGAYHEGALGPALGRLQLALGLGGLGGAYGAISGAVLGLLTVRAAKVWRPALGGLLGFGGVGLLAGAGLGSARLPDLLAGGSGALLAVLTAFLVIAQVAGDWLIARGIDAAADSPADRAEDRQLKLTVATVGLVTLGIWGLAQDAVTFVQSRPSDAQPLAVPTRPGPGCPAPADPLERAAWQVTTDSGRPDYSCGNAFVGFLHVPAPDPAFSDQPATPAGGYDGLAAQIRGARREVLLAVMEWDDTPEPGGVLARAVAALYAQVQAQPWRYPDGVTVRISLGNFPLPGTLEWGTQVYGAARALITAGVPFSDPARRWQVEVANYAGTFPHSHAKLLVTDGEALTVMGFNVGPLHLPSATTGGRGGDLRDLAVQVRGPVAADGLNVFDDLWARSRRLTCPPGIRPAAVDSCTLSELAKPDHPQGTDQFPLREAGEDRVFSLYRRAGFQAADAAVVGMIDAAQAHIDLMHVSFSMRLRCNLALLNPALCRPDDALPWMSALVRAAGRGVSIRALLYEQGLLGLENRIGVAGLRQMLRAQGLDHRLEVRWFPGPLHAKTMLVDGRLLVVGSQNLHYSSWEPRGLNEYSLATSAPAATTSYAREFALFWGRSSRAELPDWLKLDRP